jgi:glycosyltransferase involved in cell wall biosynthesis
MKTWNLSKRILGKAKREGPWAVVKAIPAKFAHKYAVHKKNRLYGGKRGDSQHILYVLGDTYGESKRYRVYNVLEAVSLFGMTGRVTTTELLPFQNPGTYDIVVFFRCAESLFTNGFLARCKAAGVPAVYDIDDLIFDSRIVNQLQALQHLDTAHAVELIQLHRKFMEACDYITASTQYLCNYISELTSKKTFLIRNGLNREQIKIASEIGRPERDECVIGFLSGSKTHDMDFVRAAPALENILTRYAHVKLALIGPVEPPDSIKKFRDRILQLPLMDYRDLMYACSRLYAVIIPLEYETAFCNAKSELKYFEQALVGVPVIASPTTPYRECIAHGVNGMLVKAAEEWENALSCIIDDTALHDTLASNAKEHIKPVYYPEAIGIRASDVYFQITEDFRKIFDRR